MRTPRPWLSIGLFMLAIGLLGPTAALAQTGAASLTGIVTDRQRRGRARRDRHRHQPGHERRLHRRLERGRQLHRHVAARRHLRRQGGARRASRRPRPSRSRWKRSRSSASTSSWSSARVEETVEVTSESPVLQTETATVGEVISGTTLSALPLNGRNTGQLSLLLPGVRDAEPELVHRRSATSAAAGLT